MTNFYQNRNNLSRITINESGKTPKKQYVLHVRKLDRIQSNSKMRMVYTNNMEERGPIKTDFNHKIVVIKNITNNGEKMKYSNSTFNSNIARKVINDTGKIIKKQVEVSPRKNEIIKSAKKPFKLTYTNFLENKNSTSNFNTNQITNKKTEEKINSNTNNKINLLNRFNHRNKINRNSNNSRDSRNKNSGNNNGTDSKLTAIKITQIKNGNSSRNNSRGNSVNKNKSLSRNENIVTNTKIITKTTSEMKFNQNQNEGEKVVKKVKTVRRIRKSCKKS
jgi:hypothetical protein